MFVLTRKEALRRRTLAIDFANKHGIPHPGLVKTPPVSPPYLHKKFRDFITRLHIYLKHNGHPNLVVTNGFDTPFLHAITPTLSRSFADPFRDIVNFAYNGHDHGFDITGSGPIYSPGPAVVRIVNNSSGWVGGKATSLEFIDSVLHGKWTYFAENLTLLGRVGETVDKNTVIATLHDSYPWMECGWAVPNTDTYFPADRNTSPWGINYQRFIRHYCGNLRIPDIAQNPGLPLDWPHW